MSAHDIDGQLDMHIEVAAVIMGPDKVAVLIAGKGNSVPARARDGMPFSMETIRCTR
ncbi:Uncharacterised protein [Yersinia enterocolitica]|nr:Uncharacterised protein [Yersinia enterocolitica]